MTTLAVGILALGGVALVVYLVVSANRRRKAVEAIPPAMRPAYSDEQLESSVLERYMAWGVVLTLFFAVFFPIYWIMESGRLNQEIQTFFVDSVVRGEDEYNNLCIECHGDDGAGGFAPSPYGGSWPAPRLTDIAVRYADNPNITDIRRFVHDTIDRGRPGTPMPAWGTAFGGPLNDQQIEDIVDWIVANQVDEPTEATAAVDQSGEDLYAANCMKCHGENLEGVVAPSLLAVFERHSEDTILGILRNGIYVPTGVMMPPWQNGHMYQGARYTDDALQRVVDYLRERQDPDAEPEEADSVAPTEPPQPSPAATEA